MPSIEISKNVYSVGAKDFKRRVFDALIPLPDGTSYNSYLITGNSKNALIDTVNPGFEKRLIENIKGIIPLERLDYLIMNHAEPDHANGINAILKEAKNAKLVVGKTGVKPAKDYYKVPQERMVVVDEKTVLDLGGKTLKFIEAPMLHWPETIFTYLVEDKILFPCDFFGQHYATEKTFANEVDSKKLEDLSKRYYGEIMLPFRNAGANALNKLKNYKIEMIAPSHGVIFKNPEWIIFLYEKWAAGKLDKKVLLLQASMWGTCERLSDEFEKTLKKKGIGVSRYDLVSADLGDIARDLVDHAAIVVSAPTVLGSVHPLASHAANLAKLLKPPAKYAAVISSYGWVPAAAREISKILDGLPIEIVGAVELLPRPGEENLKQVSELAEKLAEKVNSI